MAKKLKLQNIKKFSISTHEGAAAYDLRGSHPLIHLTFTMGSALLTDGFYETQQDQVRNLANALLAAHKAEPRFPWQYAAWMRDPVRGKGNRIQGSLVPALLDGLLGPSDHTEDYVAKALSHRPDDVTAFMTHFKQLGLGAISASARRGMARALAGFDEYQLMKYTASGEDVRLCDAILFVRKELEALGEEGKLALTVADYLHAPSRARDAKAEALPLTRARRALWRKDAAFVNDRGFIEAVGQARVTWEQLFGHFGVDLEKLTSAGAKRQAAAVNNKVWWSILHTPGLMPDMALMRNLRNMHEAGFSKNKLTELVSERPFREVWPHQVYAGAKTVPDLLMPFEAIFARSIEKLPPGRHLGIGDASGSMAVKVGGPMSSLASMDVAFCLTGLMSETSGLGASFSDAQFASWSAGRCLVMAEREEGESALKFALSPKLRVGMGGTQVFGAVMELITWLKNNRRVAPPDCLWFFSDMQFHPAAGGKDCIPKELLADAKRLGVGTQDVPPLQVAIELYRKMFGKVDVVLWNLAAYAPVPVPADMDGVLLVSGFDANTFASVKAWRDGKAANKGADKVAQNQEVILDLIRSF
jgi:hypothetical protein